jgi:dTDP-4-dehydrorhamnose 3,5-epimerase-like enzyme
MKETEIATIIKSGSHTDDRGTLIFFKDFDVRPVKRIYILEHPDVRTVRAWQGHKHEQKWFYVVSGSFNLVLIQPDSWDSPSPNLQYKEFLLSAPDYQVLHVPGGYATGFKAIEQNSKMLVFSSFTVEESLDDDYRFDRDKWYSW